MKKKNSGQEDHSTKLRRTSMKKFILTLALLAISGNCHAFPNMKKYDHESSTLEDGNKAYSQKGYQKLKVYRTKSLNYISCFDKETNTEIDIYFNFETDDATCVLSKKGRDKETSQFYYLVELEHGKVLYFEFGKGRYIFNADRMEGWFQTWENDSNRYDI